MRMLLCLYPFAARRRPGYIPFRRYQRMFVHRLWLQNIKLTRAVSWYKLVTYVGVGRCVIYIALVPLALGCVNNAASYTSVCNLYMQATLTVFTQSDAAATNYFLLQKWAASIRGRLLNGGGTYFCYINTMMTLLASLEVQVTSEHLRVGPN